MMNDVIFACTDNQAGFGCESVDAIAELDTYYYANDVNDLAILTKDEVDWQLRSVYMQDEDVVYRQASIFYLAQFLSQHCSFKSTIIRVIDGDTLVLDSLKIRLKGIDAPETKQTCLDKKDGQIWPCGKVATEMLIALVAKQEIQCTDEGKDRYRRQLSYCYSGGINLNAEMVRQGYAIAYTYYDISFIAEEAYAKSHKNGIWTSDFVSPSDWRRAR
jgi:endonuclease YncB( thermonuclease family)